MYQENNKKQLNICFGSDTIPKSLNQIFTEEFNSIISYTKKNGLEDFVKRYNIDIVLFNKDKNGDLFERLRILRNSYPNILIFICAEVYTASDLIQCIDLKVDARLVQTHKKESLKDIILACSIKYLQQQKHIKKYLEKQSVL